MLQAKKTSLVVGGTRTQVLAGRMAIATSVAPSRPSYVMSNVSVRELKKYI